MTTLEFKQSFRKVWRCCPKMYYISYAKEHFSFVALLNKNLSRLLQIQKLWKANKTEAEVYL